MDVAEQHVTDNYALYNGDSCEIMKTFPDESIHLSVYSPPFATEGGGCLYSYSSSERDLSNCRGYEEFFEHYRFIVSEIHRMTLPGRLTAVHCMDIPRGSGKGLIDFPGHIIKMHEELGFLFWCRHWVWKEPLGVRNRTMAKGLAHKQTVEDASLCDVASADCLLIFRKKGTNPIPITHPTGFEEYAGERQMPAELLQYKNFKGKQRENRYSHWIWRQYASSFWDDVRIDRVLPYKESRDEADERHMHPLQLDVIERLVIMRSNPGETVFSPFAGVGSEVYGAVANGRKGVGIELKTSYYNQMVKNVEAALNDRGQQELF